MKNLIKVIMTVAILTLMFIKVYGPLMSENSRHLINNQESKKENLSKNNTTFKNFYKN